MASLRSSVEAVPCRLQLRVEDCHLWLPRKIGNDWILEYLRPHGGMLDAITVMGNKASGKQEVLAPWDLW